MKPSVCVTAFDVCPATPRLPYVHRSSLRGVNEIYPSGFARKQDERKCRCSRPVDTQRPLHGHVRGKVTHSTHQRYDRGEGVVRPITSAGWSHSRECLAHSFFSPDMLCSLVVRQAPPTGLSYYVAPTETSFVHFGESFRATPACGPLPW